METEKALKEKELKEIEDATKKLKKAMEGVGCIKNKRNFN